VDVVDASLRFKFWNELNYCQQTELSWTNS